MLELEQAQEKILAAIQPLPSESVSLSEAFGRILAQEIRSPIDLPPFDNSAMDGYAVRAADLISATADAPISLQRIGIVPAGKAFPGSVETGTCVRIFTGSPLPPGADAVVMQEDTRIDSAAPEKIWFLDTAKLWENIRLRGEDVKQNSLLVEVGEKLTTGRLSLLAAVGISQVRVGRQPVVALLATGSELRDTGQPLEAGAIFESNRIGLSALIRQAGGVPKIFPLVLDDLATTIAALEKALHECDLVITSGGVSVGEFDFVKTAFEQLGGKMDFWKVAIKPGRPFVFGRWREKFLFGLPGNPVSALATCFLLARPALLRLQGAKDVSLPAHPGRLAEPFTNTGARRHFVRVTVGTSGNVRSAGSQASHILSALAQANGLVDVPPQTSLAAGTTIQVLRWD
jgi:molybdopterin molybdotransferase